jgi:adenosylcobinamide kinase / adenosylcobinamide-phosphate guanylyltransferase
MPVNGDTEVKLILVTGGARSGKSFFAEKLALELNGKNMDKKAVAYVATSEAMDEEFAERIRIHRSRRGDSFLTYEEPLDISSVINENLEKHDVFLIECLTTWLGNIFHKKYENREAYASSSLESLKAVLGTGSQTVIFVTNEIGLGIVPDNEMSRSFRDTQGRSNCFLASIADSVYFVISGIPMKIK